MSDIDWKTAERDLFVRLATMSDAMIFVTDLEANTSLWVNDALVETTGYSLDDYRFQRFENPFIPAEDLATVGAFLGEFLESDQMVSEGSVRNRFVDRWGGTLHVRSRVAKVVWDGRDALLYSTVLEDRESPSREAEQRYRSLVELATDAIVRLRPDLTVHFSNRCFQSLVGCEPVVLSARPFPELVVEAWRAEIREQLIGDAPRVPFSAPVCDADGSEIWLEGTFVRITRGPDAGLLHAILRDTTERRRLDARVAQTQKRETLGQMAGGIAHDLNNILTGILGAATLGGTDAEPGSALAEALSDIRIAAQRAGELSSSMLAYAGEGNVEREAVDLAALVAEMKPLLSSALAKGVTLRVKHPGTAIAIMADQTQLRQVVMNLITNAADASDGGGEIAVEAGVREPEPSLGAGEHEFGAPLRGGLAAFVRVRDRGIGMSPDVLRRIFDPFFSTKAKGRGLGLAAVQGILVRHGGCVRVRSEVGVGTEMEVWLPLSEVPIEAREAKRDDEPTAAGVGTVLVVDDEAMLRRLARRVLEPIGYRVVEARSGEEALEVLGAQPQGIAVVLLDQSMPGMGGDQALVRIRTDHPELPVIRTSGYTADPRRSAPDPHTRFLGKPYGVQQLVDAVRLAIRSES